MILDLILAAAIVLILAGMRRQSERLKLLEKELDAFRTSINGQLRKIVDITSANVAGPIADIAPTEPEAAAAAAAVEPAEAVAETAIEEPLASAEEADDAGPQPWQTAEQVAAEEPSVAPARPRPDIETALGTRWTVWVGGLALALGGVFLVRYSIEAGIFGPGVRLTFATLFGLALAAAGEIARRRGFAAPIGGMSGAYVPAILTAASAFTLFGAVFAAHGIYGFVGPIAAFILLALIGLATLAAALVHGQALAGLGLLGSYLTPVLVASDAPNPWTFFLYLTVVLVSAVAVASLRRWRLLATAAYVGSGLWTFVYLAAAAPGSLAPVLVLHLAGLAALGGVWLGTVLADAAGDLRRDPTAATAGLFAALTALVLAAAPEFLEFSGARGAALLIVAMIAVAAWRSRAIALLHAGGIATLLVQAQGLPGAAVEIDLWDFGIGVDAVWTSPEADAFLPYGAGLALILLGAGVALAWKEVAENRRRAASFAFWAAALPLGILVVAWLSSANLDIDWRHAGLAFVLAAVLAAAAELVARAERGPQTGGWAVTFLATGASATFGFALMAGFGPFLTTILTGLAAALPAAVTRMRRWPALGWLSGAFAAATLGRVVVDPTIVGQATLSATPVFNALLPAYLLPALAFAYAAWQLKRTTDGRPRLIMEAFAALFTLVGLAMLVRHAMNGGVIDATEPTLGEQAIYTLIAIGAGAILLALDRRSPSPVFRYGSIAIGLASVAFIVIQHFIVLNPVVTNASTGSIPFVNVLLLAYLLPALAMGALAYVARGKRPDWYVGILASVAAALGFVYVTLSVRRIFQGEFIGQWKGMQALETYAYSAVWLAIGVGVLVAGLRLNSRTLRIGSAALVVLAVAKVFLFDMSELEGVLRALSFIGLGGVLIGIGMFYQRMLVTPSK